MKILFSAKRIKKFVREGRDAPKKDTDQFYRRNVFEYIYIKDFTTQEKRRTQKAIIIMDQNNTTIKLKVRMVFNGKPTRECFSREDTSSHTASLEDCF